MVIKSKLLKFRKFKQPMKFISVDKNKSIKGNPFCWVFHSWISLILCVQFEVKWTSFLNKSEKSATRKWCSCTVKPALNVDWFGGCILPSERPWSRVKVDLPKNGDEIVQREDDGGETGAPQSEIDFVFGDMSLERGHSDAFATRRRGGFGRRRFFASTTIFVFTHFGLAPVKIALQSMSIWEANVLESPRALMSVPVSTPKPVSVSALPNLSWINLKKILLMNFYEIEKFSNDHKYIYIYLIHK